MNNKRFLPGSIIVSGLLYVASQAIILIILDPLGVTVIRFQLSFDGTTLAKIMAGWGDAGISRFRHHFFLDFLHPFIYGSFLFFILSYIKSKLPDEANPGVIPVYCHLPFAATVLDLIENIVELIIIYRRAAIPEGLAFMNGLVSSSKWFLAAASLLLIGILGVRLGLRSFQSQRNGDRR
jgi:hypothetical protein